MKVRKYEFLNLLELLIDKDIMPYGEIKVNVYNDKINGYEIYHHCGLGTFTGIGYQYVVGGLYEDRFTIQTDAAYYEFWLLCLCWNYS